MPTVVDLSYEHIESLISEINLGGKLVSVTNGSGEAVLIFMAHCTGLDKMRAEFEYKIAYDKAVADGFLTVEETRELIKAKGADPVVDEEEIERLENKIKGQEAYLSKLTRVPARRNRAIENLNRMKDELDALLNKREEGLEYSAEKVAFEQKFLYMTWCGTRDAMTKERYWPTRKDFDKEKDLIFRREMFLNAIRMSGGLDVGTLRYLARSNVWRIRYLTSVKTGESLFGTDITNYTVDQLALAYWSHYYQSVFEMLPEDRPPDSIIEDDAALDAYMKSYMEEMNREATSARESKQMGRGVKSAWDHGETLVFRSNELYEDIEYTETVESIRNKGKTDIKPKHPKKR